MTFKRSVLLIVTVLLLLTMLWAGLYFLLGVSGYDDFFPPFLCSLFSLISLLFSVTNLIARHCDAKCGERTLSGADVIWTVFSFASLTVHGCGFYRIFGMLSAG